nr:uncharacterized protein LOC118705261 [Pipistrellus kuhlii]
MTPHLLLLLRSPHDTPIPSRSGQAASDHWGFQRVPLPLSLTLSPVFHGGEEKAEAEKEVEGPRGDRGGRNGFLFHHRFLPGLSPISPCPWEGGRGQAWPREPPAIPEAAGQGKVPRRPRPPLLAAPLPTCSLSFLSPSSQTGGAAAEPASSGTGSSGRPLPPQLPQRAMAWEATCLLPLVLLVLLASGSWEQQVQKLEGEELFVTCQYPPQRSSKTKTWCRIISAETCVLLVTHPRLRGQPGDPRYVIMDYPQQRYFTVTKAVLREKDSGLYWCGILESSIVTPLRAIRLVVSPGESFPSVCASQVP